VIPAIETVLQLAHAGDHTVDIVITAQKDEGSVLSFMKWRRVGSEIRAGAVGGQIEGLVTKAGGDAVYDARVWSQDDKDDIMKGDLRGGVQRELTWSGVQHLRCRRRQRKQGVSGTLQTR